eukprot:4978722-Amphidinium_carterae.1
MPSTPLTRPSLVKRRWDFTSTSTGGRGAKRRALEIADDAAELARADASYEDLEDAYAATSRRTLASRSDTWSALHRRVFADSLEVFPITGAKLGAIVAVLKAAGYKSALAYASAARIHSKEL